MKLTLKFSTLTGLLCLLVPGLMWAGTVYTYTGNPYTDCTGTYVCTGTSPALSLTFDTPLTGTQLDNLYDDPIPVSSFSFTDGTGLFITQANEVFHDLIISTDANGAITGWYIVALTTEPPPYVYFRLNSWFNEPETNGVTGDDTILGPNPPIIGDGEVLTHGVWNSPSVPEPSTFMLLGTSVLGVGGFFRRRLIGS